MNVGRTGMALHPSLAASGSGPGPCFPPAPRYSPSAYRTAADVRRHCMSNATSAVILRGSPASPQSQCRWPGGGNPFLTQGPMADSVGGSVNEYGAYAWPSPPKWSGRGKTDQYLLVVPPGNGNLFAGLDDPLMTRGEALATMEIGKHSPGSLHIKPDVVYHPGMSTTPRPPPQMMDAMDLLDPLCPPPPPPPPPLSMADCANMNPALYSHPMNTMMGHSLGPHHHMPAMHDLDTDPRELESFAEKFKQRRIKLGVTQADVGRALASLKLPGVGCLSQSTICRFESLTLSHNNMVALKPILQTWLEAAEEQAKNKRRDPDTPSLLPGGEKKRKRTSIAGPEKRSLEAYFAVQPRPSGEKIAAIAEKLDLKKNVVRVWFCNQRQKQKRMKYSAQQH